MTAVDRRTFLRAGAAWAAAGLVRPAQAQTRRPNVIVILTDDQGYADVGFHGCRDFATPHLDALAASGAQCPQGSVSHPFCSPTRAGLLTGRYQQRFGHENNPTYLPQDPTVGLPLDQLTLPQLLRPAGYVTGHVGKWHLGAHESLVPLARGFDHSFGFRGGGHDYFQRGTSINDREYLIPLERDGQPVPEEEYLTDALSREAVEFVRRQQDRPFFLYLAYNAPHTPLQAPEKYLERVAGLTDPNRRAYAAMMCAVDDGVGRLLATLDELDLTRETLVFYFSDNGGAQGLGSDNTPLRGHKGSIFEGGVRVPFVVRWPGRLTPGVYPHPVSSLDVLATTCAAAGATLPADRPLDSVDLLPYLTGERTDPPHERLFWRTGGGRTWAVREGRWKLASPARMEPLLFDLEADPSETSDRAAAEPAVVARLRAAYDDWSRQLIPPLFESPRPPQPRPAARGE